MKKSLAISAALLACAAVAACVFYLANAVQSAAVYVTAVSQKALEKSPHMARRMPRRGRRGRASVAGVDFVRYTEGSYQRGRKRHDGGAQVRLTGVVNKP